MEFSLQTNVESSEIDERPGTKEPAFFGRVATVVGDAENEMMRILQDFVRFYFRFEIEGPERARFTGCCKELWIEVKDSARSFIDYAQVRVSGPLKMAVSSFWIRTGKSRDGIDFLKEDVF